MPLKRSYCDNIVYNNGLNNMPSGHSEIKTCPNCGTVISLEASDIESVVTQVRDEEFRKKQDANYISDFDRETAKYLKGSD